MKLIIKWFLCFVLVLNNLIFYAQNNELDSLKLIVKTSKEDTNKVFVLIKVSRQLCSMSNYDSSISYSKKAYSLAQKLLAENSESGPANYSIQKGIAMSFNVLGLNYFYLGDYPKALNYLSLSLNVSKKINDHKGIAAAYGNIGNIYYEQGNYPEALKTYLLTLKIRDKIGDKKGLAFSYVSLGNVYSIMHYYSESLKYYSKAIKLFEEFGDKRSLAGTYNNIAGVYTAKGYYDQALKMYDSYLKILLEFDDQQSIGTTYGNIGNIYYYKSDYPKALQDYLAGLKIQTEIDDKPGITLSFISIGQTYMELGDYKKSEFYILRGLELSKEINELERIKQAYGALSDLYEKTGNGKKALVNYKFFIAYKDSLINEENTKKTTRIEMNYEFDKKEAANKLEQEKKEEISVAERKKQQIIIWSVCAILILVLCFAIFVYRSFLQKRKAHIEIMHQKHIIEEKQNSILDSIHYAKRIQTALITSEKYIDRSLNRLIKGNNQNMETSFDTKKFFILYQPKDIVSGDFYYALAHQHPESEVEKFYLCTADCTGHGVPGAFMSMLNISYLNESIIEKKTASPNLVLDNIRDEIIASLNPEGSEEESKDGMDCVLCAFDFTNNILEYAAANNNFYIVRNGLLISCAADKMPVGKHSDMKPFELRKVHLEKGDMVYLLTDGYADQFGGPKGKKFKYKPLEQLLVSNYKLSMDEQKEVLNKNFEVWKGNLEQVDDVLLIGIRV